MLDEKNSGKSIQWKVIGTGSRHHCSTPYPHYSTPPSDPVEEPTPDVSSNVGISNSQLTKKRPYLIPAAVAALMLFGALGQWPYGYYQLLRIVVCGISVYIAFSAYNWQKLWVTWLFGFIALLFNPLIPIHLSREIWQPIDVLCGILFLYVIAMLRKPTQKSTDGFEGKDCRG
ncbi:MAG TPA: DUF6804 family protein [Sedimentisphaerales bacterium]|nr:DUF6804 family protein [Sedimentisphaerales bacterium]